LNIKKIIVGSDHGGFELKEALKPFVQDLGYEVVDFGCHSREAVDYPDIALLEALGVAKDPDAMGIMIDGAGVASGIACNKVTGVFAAVCWDQFSAKIAREHDDANVLCLGGQVIGPAKAKEVVREFLCTEFGGGRHQRRVNKILSIQSRFMREEE